MEGGSGHLWMGERQNGSRLGPGVGGIGSGSTRSIPIPCPQLRQSYTGFLDLHQLNSTSGSNKPQGVACVLLKVRGTLSPYDS